MPLPASHLLPLPLPLLDARTAQGIKPLPLQDTRRMCDIRSLPAAQSWTAPPSRLAPNATRSHRCCRRCASASRSLAERSCRAARPTAPRFGPGCGRVCPPSASPLDEIVARGCTCGQAATRQENSAVDTTPTRRLACLACRQRFMHGLTKGGRGERKWGRTSSKENGTGVFLAGRISFSPRTVAVALAIMLAPTLATIGMLVHRKTHPAVCTGKPIQLCAQENPSGCVHRKTHPAVCMGGACSCALVPAASPALHDIRAVRRAERRVRSHVHALLLAVRQQFVIPVGVNHGSERQGGRYRAGSESMSPSQAPSG
eukprot:361082-Chlamydomonas_euryale.AAC.9